MTPKEKASELFNKMFIVEDPMGSYPMCYDTALQCALIAVDEIISLVGRYSNYWQEVKQELNKSE